MTILSTTGEASCLTIEGEDLRQIVAAGACPELVEGLAFAFFFAP